MLILRRAYETITFKSLFISFRSKILQKSKTYLDSTLPKKASSSTFLRDFFAFPSLVGFFSNEVIEIKRSSQLRLFYDTVYYLKTR